MATRKAFGRLLHVNSPDHIPPPPVPTSKGRRRWLAIIEGLSFSWLLLIGHLVVYKMERMKTNLVNHAGLPQEEAEFTSRILTTELSTLIIYLHPECFEIMLTGTGLAGIGFGLLSSRTPEALHSRLFRWTCVGLATVLFGILGPWISIFSCLCGGPDETWLDEVLFVIPGALLLLVALRRIRKTRYVSV